MVAFSPNEAMKTALRLLSALLAACATSASAAEPNAASPVFGAGIDLPGITITPSLAVPGWSFRGSSGGLDADADGWRAFRLRTANEEGSPVLEGRARFEAADGAVRAEWHVVPTADATLLETFVGGNLANSLIAGGTAVLDGKPLAIALDGAKPHPFRGPVTDMAFLDRDGVEHLRIVFDRPTRVLLQDGAYWGGSHLTLRFFLKEGNVEGGVEYALGATFSTPAAGPLALGPGAAVTIQAGPDWIPLPYDPWIEPGSALDFSSVLPHHSPAGKFGRLNAVGDHFEFEGLPGVPQRFYGVNLCGTANLPSSREAADRFVANIARVGYNALRVHHHERTLIAEDGRPHPDLGDAAPTPAQWEKFDNLVAACVENGVYLTTDLFVSRSHVTSWRSIGIDQDGYLSNTAHFKILCAFWEPAYSNLCTWTKNFLCHVNPRTGRSLAEEPALVTLALINEGNLGNWGGGILRSLPGVQDAWKAWLTERRNDAALRAHDANSSLPLKERPVIAAEGGPSLPRETRPVIDWDSIPDTIPDNLKASGGTSEALLAGAFAMFLADRETALFERLKTFVRDECGCKAPLSSLSSWYNPVQYQLPRTHFDYVDDHFYVDHPKFLDRSWSLPSSCPNVNPIAGSSAGARSVEWRRLMDKPFCLTEWNYSGPGRFRGVGGIATGALGALQGWDGMWRFAWSHGRGGIEKPGGRMGYFDMNSDPLGLAAERAALCLFLRRDLPELETSYPLVLDEATLCDPATGAPPCELPAALWAGWHAKVGSVVKTREESVEGPCATLRRTAEEVRADLAALGAAEAALGAVSIDSATGTFLLNTPRTAGGFAEAGEHEAGAIRFALSDAAATVWASSLDNSPISASSHVLVTHLTDVQNSGIRYGDPGLTILLDWGRTPHLARRGAAEVSLTAAPGEWSAWRLDTAGRRLAEVPVSYDADAGRLFFTARTDLDPAAATLFYELVRRDSAP